MSLDSMTRRTLLKHAACGAGAAAVAGLVLPHSARGVTGFNPNLDAPWEAWDGLAELALKRVRDSGAEYGDIRLLRTRREFIIGRDGRIAGINQSADAGFGVRVLYHGGWGFASSPLMDEASLRKTTDLAIEIAKASAAHSDPIRLAPEPPHVDTVVTPRRRDPFDVPQAQKTDLLLAAMSAMQSVDGVRRSNASVWAQHDLKLFASTEGSKIRFDLLAVNGQLGATAVQNGQFDSRSFMTPYFRSGYELVERADLLSQAPRVAAEAVEKVRAPRPEPGAYDLVLDPGHLALTIHESCGHPSELDRALGYEANYAGTSHLTPDKLGAHRYGSKHVNLVADNTEPGCLASTGYDDDGVAGQRWDIVREGLFVGFSSNREVAPLIGLNRSAGSCRADSWSSVPIVRIANIGLEPGDGKLDDMIADVKNGIYIEGRGSFSIDQKRYNFQFGGNAFWRIENGKRTHMLRDVIYTGITPEFWGRCDAVADRSHRQTMGFITCGKGQPGQSGWMTHAACHARFRGINVIRGETT